MTQLRKCYRYYVPSSPRGRTPSSFAVHAQVMQTALLGSPPLRSFRGVALILGDLWCPGTFLSTRLGKREHSWSSGNGIVASSVEKKSWHSKTRSSLLARDKSLPFRLSISLNRVPLFLLSEVPLFFHAASAPAAAMFAFPRAKEFTLRSREELVIQQEEGEGPAGEHAREKRAWPPFSFRSPGPPRETSVPALRTCLPQLFPP